MSGDGSRPILWHLKVSNYNEKARWALDYKAVPHVRRAVLPGRHAKLARKLWGGDTLPALKLDGQVIGDSTRIIERLERRHPTPPLYPADPAERRQSLELEEFFDEQLGPYVRLLVLHHTLPDARLMLGAFAPDLEGGELLAGRAMFPLIRRRIVADFGIDPESVKYAYRQLEFVGERFLAELGSDDYLVGGTFTVADLTLASMLAPALAPPEYPYPQPHRAHPRLEPLREACDVRLRDWTMGMYSRHRGRSAEVSP